MLGCNACGFLSRPWAAGHTQECARWGASLHVRKPYSISRTWAFLIAAAILYIPANVLPVMETGSLFGAQKDTILSGVVYLWTSGDRKSTRLNSSHGYISYAVFCLKKKNISS